MNDRFLVSISDSFAQGTDDPDHPLLQFCAIRKGIANLFTQHKIGAVHAIVSDRLELGGVNLSIGQDGFIGADVDHLAHQTAAFCIIAGQLALHGHGQFRNDGCIHKRALFGVGTGFSSLFGTPLPETNPT